MEISTPKNLPALFQDLAQVKTVEQGAETIEAFRKAQGMRLWDSYFIGPLLMYYGFKGRLGLFSRLMLVTMGAGTLIYNYHNFKKNKYLAPILNTAEAQMTELLSPGNNKVVQAKVEQALDENEMGYYTF